MAAQTLLGSSFRVTKRRGEFIEGLVGPVITATVHPSSIVPAPDGETRQKEMAAFIADLRAVATRMAGVREGSWGRQYGGSMATRRLVAAMALVLVLVGAGACSDGGFGDFASQTTSTVRPGPSVTLGGPPTSDTQPADTTTTTLSTATSSTAPPTTVRSTGQPASTPPSQPVVTGARTDATASNLTAAPSCEGGRPLVRLTWAPVGNAEQVVAVSSRPDGLDSGNYTSSEVLPASRAVYELRESQPGGFYYWRVLTRRGSGFAASETSQFQGPSCTTS
ncbi:MAG: hypothetical protein ACRD2W_09060 [Acidimicrobiales bacterium]